MDKEIAIKLGECIKGYDLKFVKQLRQFLKLVERKGIPIQDVYKYADDVHRVSMSMADHGQEVIMNDVMPKCPECGHVLELIGICDDGFKTANNLKGYKYMYYCDNCLYEEFKSDRTVSEEYERLIKENK